MMSMIKGDIVNISRKHNMSVASSTESELVNMAQGYTIENKILYQDNKSTILLDKNGRMSAGKNSKHIKHRLLLINDKVAQREL